MYFIALVSVLVIEGINDEGVAPIADGSLCAVCVSRGSADTEESFGGSGGGVRLRSRSPGGAVDASLSVEIIDADLPLRMFVSTKPDVDELSELVLLHVCTTCALASRSCNSLPASSRTPLTSPSAACIDNSTAGLARAGGAAGPLVSKDEPGRCGKNPEDSALGLCRRTSLIESSAVGSLGCSLRVITAEYVSGSCHPTSSWSGSGSEVALPRNRFKEEPGVKKEERDSSGVDVGAAGRVARMFVVDMLANSRW